MFIYKSGPRFLMFYDHKELHIKSETHPVVLTSLFWLFGII